MKSNHTKELLKIDQYGSVSKSNGNSLLAKGVGFPMGANDEATDNSKLIVDAFNTTNSCNLLPSELLKQRDELLEGLRLILSAYVGTFSPNSEVIADTRELIKSCSITTPNNTANEE